MSKLRIWWVEDEQTAVGRQAILDAFGSCCHIETFRTATEAIRLLMNASDASSLPNVALIDLRLRDADEDPALVGDDIEGRGFIVAAELNYKALDLNLSSDEMPRYILYTGNVDVQRKYGAAAGKTPLGHPALLHLEAKASVGDEGIVEWAIEELHALALRRLRLGKSGIRAEEIVNLQKEYLDILAQSEAAAEAYTKSFDQLVLPAIERFLKVIEEAENATRLPISNLTRARDKKDVSEVLQILTLSNEWPGQALMNLTQAIEDYQDSDDARATNAFKKQIERRLTELCNGSLIANGNGPLAEVLPCEANGLLKRGAVEIWLPALAKIIEMLSVIDYNLLLARTLKKLQINFGTKVDRQALTSFAYTTHEIHQHLMNCTHCLQDNSRNPNCITPTTGDFIQDCLLNEMQWQGKLIKESVLADEVKVLPSRTVERMKGDGMDFVTGLPSRAIPQGPLLSFAARYSYEVDFPLGTAFRRPRENWHEKWSDALCRVFDKDNVVVEPDGNEEPWFLTDWREFFGSDDGRYKGLIMQLQNEVRTDGNAHVKYIDDGDVIITLTWPTVEFRDHRVDQVRPEMGRGGGLASVLQGLNEWGDVVVKIKNLRNEMLKLTTIPFIPGQDRNHEDAADTFPGFQFIWKLTNYLEKRGWKDLEVKGWKA